MVERSVHIGEVGGSNPPTTTMEGENQAQNTEIESSRTEFHAHFPGATTIGLDTVKARYDFEKKYGKGGYLFPSSALPVAGEHRRVRFETPRSRAEFNASKILEMAGDKHIIISGSSSGVKDIIETLHAMLQKGVHDRDISILIMNTPGLAESGAKGLGKFVRDYVRMFSTMNTVEQHITYPGPEKLYENLTESPKIKRKTVDSFEDTPLDREERRFAFMQNLDHLIPDPDERRSYIARLDAIDAEIEIACDQQDDSKKDALLAKRGKFLEFYKEKYFHGGQIDQANADRLLAEYGEVKRNILVRFGMLAQTAIFALGLVNDMGVGYEKILADVAYKARKHRVRIKMGIAVMEKDQVAPPSDLQDIVDNFAEVAIDLAWLGYFQNMGHVTVGQYPKAILDAAEAMRR